VLVQVNAAKGETYVQIELDEVDRITVVQGGNGTRLTLKSGKEFILRPDEAQRVVNAMRKADDDKLELT
jgi:cell division septal protein FtsQ